MHFGDDACYKNWIGQPEAESTTNTPRIHGILLDRTLAQQAATTGARGDTAITSHQTHSTLTFAPFAHAYFRSVFSADCFMVAL